MVQATTPTTDALEPQTATDSAAQTLEAAPASAEAVETGVGAATEGAGLKFETDEDFERALETIPELRARIERERKQANDNGFNAGRQNRDKELRLERGSEDSARQYQDYLRNKYQIDLDEADQRDLPLLARANRDRARVDYWRDNSGLVMDAFDVNEREQIQAAFETFDGNPEQVEQIGRQIIDEAVKRQTVKRVASLTMEEIPQDSPLWQSMQAHIRAEFDKEAAAQAQEREPVAPPPRVPLGDASRQRTQADYAHLTAEAIADLPEDEYRIAMGYQG